MGSYNERSWVKLLIDCGIVPVRLFLVNRLSTMVKLLEAGDQISAALKRQA